MGAFDTIFHVAFSGLLLAFSGLMTVVFLREKRYIIGGICGLGSLVCLLGLLIIVGDAAGLVAVSTDECLPINGKTAPIQGPFIDYISHLWGVIFTGCLALIFLVTCHSLIKQRRFFGCAFALPLGLIMGFAFLYGLAALIGLIELPIEECADSGNEPHIGSAWIDPTQEEF